MKTLVAFVFLASMVSSAVGFLDIIFGDAGQGESTPVQATFNTCDACKESEVLLQPDMSCSGPEPYEFVKEGDLESGGGRAFEDQCNAKAGCFAKGIEGYHACVSTDYWPDCASKPFSEGGGHDTASCSFVGLKHTEALLKIEICKMQNCSSMGFGSFGQGMRTLLRDSSVMTFPDTLVTLEFTNTALGDFLPRDGSRWSASIKKLKILCDAYSTSDMIFSESGVWPPALTSLEIIKSGSSPKVPVELQGIKVPAGTRFPDTLEYIDLHGNRLTTVCKVWPANLKYLDLNDNLLTEITTSNTVLPDKLVKLDLSNNRLTLIDSGLVWPTSLKELDLRTWTRDSGPYEDIAGVGNKLASFECNMALLGSLAKVDLSGNELTSLSAGMVLPDSLVKLDLHNNNLTEIDDGFAWSPGLELLDLSRNKLKLLGGQISNLASLTIILLFNNKLTDIPEEWPGALDQIDLRGNDLETLRATVWPDTLTTLDISVNKLKKLSENTTWPDALEFLDLGTNLLAHLPTKMAWPGQLKWLSLTNNVLEDLPKTMAWPSTLLELFLGKNKLPELPEVAWPGNLQKLILSFNDLTKLPEMSWPPLLDKMMLDHNKIRTLPDVEFPGMVRELRLSHNAFERVPTIRTPFEPCVDPWGYVDCTKVIQFTTNPRCGIMCTIAKDNNKYGLVDLSYNSIATTDNDTAALNAAMAGQPWLQLNLSNNAITNFAGIIWPEQLEVLDLSGNGIRGLPPAGNQSWPSGLTSLVLDGNSWETLMETAACYQLSAEDRAGRDDCKAASSTANTAPGLVQAGATVLPFLDLRVPSDVPCESDQSDSLLLSASHENWDCKQVDAKCPDGEPCGHLAYMCTLDCNFTEKGSTLISATEASRDVSFGIATQQTSVAKNWGYPVTAFTTVTIGYVSNYYGHGKKSKSLMDWLSLGSVGLAAVDMMTDWVFYFLELSSEGFEPLYTCNKTEQEASVNYECKVDGEPSSGFSCNDYGLLREKCGFLAKDQIEKGSFNGVKGNVRIDGDDATNECECHEYLECDTIEGLCKSTQSGNFQNAGMATDYIFLPHLNPTYLACHLKMGLADSDETAPMTHPAEPEAIASWVSADCRNGLNCTYKYDATWWGNETARQYSGMDITRDPNVRATTLEECAEICLADYDCDHFSYYNQPGCNEGRTNLAPLLENGTMQSNCVDKLPNLYVNYNCDPGEFAALDDNVGETCGFLSPNNGTNECECHTGGVCQEVVGSRGSCVVDGTGNDYEALVLACLACNIVATLLWIASSLSFVRVAFAKERAREKERADSDAKEDAAVVAALRKMEPQPGEETETDGIEEDDSDGGAIVVEKDDGAPSAPASVTLTVRWPLDINLSAVNSPAELTERKAELLHVFGFDATWVDANVERIKLLQNKKVVTRRRRATNSEGGDDGTQGPENVGRALKFLIMLVEDAPQLYFLYTYINYMGFFDSEKSETIPQSTKDTVIQSLVLSALSFGKSFIELTFFLLQKIISDDDSGGGGCLCGILDYLKEKIDDCMMWFKRKWMELKLFWRKCCGKRGAVTARIIFKANVDYHDVQAVLEKADGVKVEAKVAKLNKNITDDKVVVTVTNDGVTFHGEIVKANVDDKAVIEIATSADTFTTNYTTGRISALVP